MCVVATWPKVLGHHLNATRTPQQSRRRGVPAASGYHFLSHSAIAVLLFFVQFVDVTIPDSECLEHQPSRF